MNINTYIYVCMYGQKYYNCNQGGFGYKLICYIQSKSWNNRSQSLLTCDNAKFLFMAIVGYEIKWE